MKHHGQTTSDTISMRTGIDMRTLLLWSERYAAFLPAPSSVMLSSTIKRKYPEEENYVSI
jgi:hypothetical protein